MDMFTELNMWDHATSLANETNSATDSILKSKAQALEERKDLIAAAATYEQVGEFMQAVEILGPGGYVDALIELVRKMSTNKHAELTKCVYYFRLHANTPYAIETLTKMGDTAGRLKLLIELCQWEEAFRIAETDPSFHELLFLPYGHWLASNDRFQEAQEYYLKAGRADEAFRVLKQLSVSSARQECFKDAAYYYYSLSRESNNGEYNKLATIYHAYTQIHKFNEDPFTFALPESLLNASVFLLIIIGSKPPPGISQVYILYTLAKMANTLSFEKLSRWAFDRLLRMRAPKGWEDRIELGSLLSRGIEGAEWSYDCAQCNAPIQFNPKFDGCINCLTPTIRSMHSFDPLPIVKFVPTVRKTEAMEFINTEPSQDYEHAPIVSRDEYQPLKLDREQLLSLSPLKVFTRQGKELEFYLVIGSHASVVQCKGCQNFFGEEEWNYQAMLNGKCPFCRAKP